MKITNFIFPATLLGLLGLALGYLGERDTQKARPLDPAEQYDLGLAPINSSVDPKEPLQQQTNNATSHKLGHGKGGENLKNTEPVSQEDPGMKPQSFPGPRSLTINSQDQHWLKLANKHPLETFSFRDRKGYHVTQKLYSDGPKSNFELLVSQEKKSGDRTVERKVFVANEVVIQLPTDISSTEFKSLAAKHGLTIKRKLLLDGFYLVSSNAKGLKSFNETLKNIKSEPVLESANTNNLIYLSSTPNDEFFPLMWSLNNTGDYAAAGRNFPGSYTAGVDLKAEGGWSRYTDCRSTVIAIVDSGIDSDHPDLLGNLVLSEARNFLPDGTNPVDPVAWEDDVGHGTHVAGTIGAVGNNGIGVTGICWQAQIIPIRALGGPNNAGTVASISDAIVYASNTDALIVNASFGGKASAPLLESAFEALSNSGKILVAAAGNGALQDPSAAPGPTNPIARVNNDVTPQIPASYTFPGIISVAATDGADSLTSFSNYGQNSVDIAAPGFWVLSAYVPELNQDALYRFENGTSMATPHITGMLALLWTHAPDLSREQVIEALYDSATIVNFDQPISGMRRADLSKLINETIPQIKVDILKNGTNVNLDGKKILGFFVDSSSPIESIEVLVDGTAVSIINSSPYEAELPETFSLSNQLRIKLLDQKQRSFELTPNFAVSNAIEGESSYYYLGSSYDFTLNKDSPAAAEFDTIEVSVDNQILESEPDLKAQWIPSKLGAAEIEIALRSKTLQDYASTLKVEVIKPQVEASLIEQPATGEGEGATECQLREMDSFDTWHGLLNLNIDIPEQCQKICATIATGFVKKGKRTTCGLKGSEEFLFDLDLRRTK